MKAGRALRQMIIARLISTVPEFGSRVYDKATETAPYPYATMGPSSWFGDDADCIEGRVWSLQIDLWHSEASKGECEDLVDAVSTALKGWAGNNVVAMHPIEVRLVRVLDDPSGDVHGVVQIEIEVEDYVA